MRSEQIQVGANTLSVRVHDEAGSAAPVVIVLPALAVRSRYYVPFAEQLRTCATVLVDLPQDRGSGFREIVGRHLPATVDAVREWFPGRPVFLLGHSIGGQLAVGYLTGPDHRVDGLILVAAGTPHFRSYSLPRGLWVLVGTQLSVLRGGRLLRDWARFARTGRNPGVSGGTADGLRVLAVSVDGDHYAPPAAVDELCAQLPGARVTRRRLGGRLGHFRWARSPEQLVPLITDWLAEA